MIYHRFAIIGVTCLICSFYLNARAGNDNIINIIESFNYRKAIIENNGIYSKTVITKNQEFTYKSRKKYFGGFPEIMLERNNSNIATICFYYSSNIETIRENVINEASDWALASDNKNTGQTIFFKDKYMMVLGYNDEKTEFSIFVDLSTKNKIFKIKDASDAFKRFSPYIVSIIAKDNYGQEIRRGSGVVTWYGILTNYHIIKGAYDIQIKNGKEDINFEKIIFNPEWDIAKIITNYVNKLGPEFPVMLLGVIKPGQKVYALGNPLGLENTISEGIISGLRVDGVKQLIQITAPISHGSSGGGLFNEDGFLVGITTGSMSSGQNLNFAVSLSDVGEDNFYTYNYILHAKQQY